MSIFGKIEINFWSSSEPISILPTMAKFCSVRKCFENFSKIKVYFEFKNHFPEKRGFYVNHFEKILFLVS